MPANRHKHGVPMQPDYTNPESLSPSAYKRMRERAGILVLCKECGRGGGTLVHVGAEYQHADCDTVGRANRAARRQMA